MKIKIYLSGLIFVAAFLSCFQTRAQEVKKVTQKAGQTAYTEEFYVLKSDKSVKHGSYVKFADPSRPVETGFYKNNLKDSTWTEFHYNTEIPKSRGNFRNGERTGVWEFLNSKGQVMQKYDFTTGQLTYLHRPDQEKKRLYQVKTANGFEAMLLDQSPAYIGGAGELGKTIRPNLKYPPTALRNGTQGEVVISFLLDEKGQASDFKVKKGIGGGCDEEALRVMKLCTANWVPGVKDGKPVATICEWPINFTLR